MTRKGSRDARFHSRGTDSNRRPSGSRRRTEFQVDWPSTPTRQTSWLDDEAPPLTFREGTIYAGPEAEARDESVDGVHPRDAET
jgi:hypothetical protein